MTEVTLYISTLLHDRLSADHRMAAGCWWLLARLRLGCKHRCGGNNQQQCYMSPHHTTAAASQQWRGQPPHPATCCNRSFAVSPSHHQTTTSQQLYLSLGPPLLLPSPSNNKIDTMVFPQEMRFPFIHFALEMFLHQVCMKSQC